MIAEGLLSGCPSVDSATLNSGLFFNNELECARLCLKPVTLVVSANNPGADRVAEELAGAFRGITINSVWDHRGTRFFSIRMSDRSWSSIRKFTSSRRPAYGDSVRRQSFSASGTQFFVLYLNQCTFLDEAGKQLAMELRAIQQHSPRAILLLHEQDGALGGCEFGRWHG